MPDVVQHTVATNGIDMHVTEAGSGPAVVLCHGFPELGSSWRHQLEALAGAGYRAIAPDMRGYGGTSAPTGVEAYTMRTLAADVAGLLEALAVDRAVVVGHDWGANVAWATAMRHPARLAGVIGVSVPHGARGDIPPTQLFELFFPDRFMYMLYFQEPGVADAELGRDARATILRMYHSTSGAVPAVPADLPREGTGYLDSLAAMPDAVPGWLAGHLDELGATFQRTGFTGPLNWYRNLDRNWEEAAGLDGRVTLPAAFITGEHDPINRLLPPSVMEGVVEDLRRSVVLPGVGHWTAEEDPPAFSAALLEALIALDWPPAG